MRDHLFRSILSCLAVFSLLLPASGDTSDTLPTKDPKVSIRCTTLGPWSGKGFYPVKVVIVNDTPNQHQWDVSFSNSKLGTLRAPALQTTTTVLFLPNTEKRFQYFNELSFLPSEGKREPISLSIRSNSYNNARIGYSEKLDPDPKISGEFKSKIEHSFGSSEVITTSPADWPADPRVYSSIESLMLNKAEYDQLDQSQKRALSQWVIAGGQLFVFQIDKKVDGISVETEAKPGWGLFYQFSGQNPDKAFEYIRSKQKGKDAWSWPELPAHSKSYEHASPAGFLIMILIIFAIIIGPLCLFVWAPSSRRYRLFILIPAISLGCSLLLFSFILLIDGIGGKGMRIVEIYLNPETNTATIKQQQICRTGLILNSSFNLDPDIEFYSNNTSQEYKRSSNRSGNLMTGNWFASRSSITQQLAGTKPTRARVTLVPSNDKAPVVQSTLPCTLTDFIYKDGDGNFWKADSLHPGRPTTLTSVSKPAFKGERNSFNGTGEPSVLGPIDSLPAIKWQEGKIFFFGPVARQ